MPPAPGNWTNPNTPGPGFSPAGSVVGGGFVATSGTSGGFVDTQTIPRYGTSTLTYGSLSYSYGSTVLQVKDYPLANSAFTTANPSLGSFGGSTTL